MYIVYMYERNGASNNLLTWSWEVSELPWIVIYWNCLEVVPLYDSQTNIEY